VKSHYLLCAFICVYSSLSYSIPDCVLYGIYTIFCRPEYKPTTDRSFDHVWYGDYWRNIQNPIAYTPILTKQLKKLSDTRTVLNTTANRYNQMSFWQKYCTAHGAQTHVLLLYYQKEFDDVRWATNYLADIGIQRNFHHPELFP
jgi:hypothetical protein